MATRGSRFVLPLTERQVEVLQLLATGVTIKEAAKQLQVAPSTIKSHLDEIFNKLEVNKLASAVYVAMKTGIIR